MIMQQVLGSYLALLVMTGHAFLGCCWHHAHAPDARHALVEHSNHVIEMSTGQAPSQSPHGHHVACRHATKEASSSSAENSCPHNHDSPSHCDEHDCSFVISEAKKVPSPFASATHMGLIASVFIPYSFLTPNADPSSKHFYDAAQAWVDTPRLQCSQVWLL